MLSAFRTGALRSIVQGHGTFKVLSVVPARNASAPSKQDRIDTWDYVNSVYFGPERDMKNFPHPTQPAQHEPVRMGVLPASWFEFFYPKTGVTGPYVFLGGMTLWMMSKEIMVVDHYFWEFPAFWAMVYWVSTSPKMGPKLKQYISDKIEMRKNILYERPLAKMRDAEEKNISNLQRLLEECETASFVNQAKKEGVELQLEAAYRQRLNTAFQEVKKRLDYEVEITNVKRKFEQDHMVNWIVSSVTKSITPQQEKESIQSCIQTLKQLASKQTAAA